MPFYTCISEEGLLDDEQKERIALGITEIHCGLTGAPRHFVHVIFDTYISGNGFSGGQPSRGAFIRASIRGGRSQQVKEKLLHELTELWLAISPRTKRGDMLVSLLETPGTNVMEGGVLMPHPRDDAKWLIEHGFAD